MLLRATKTFDLGNRGVIREGSVFEINDRQGYEMLGAQIAEPAPAGVGVTPPAEAETRIVGGNPGNRKFTFGGEVVGDASVDPYAPEALPDPRPRGRAARKEPVDNLE